MDFFLRIVLLDIKHATVYTFFFETLNDRIFWTWSRELSGERYRENLLHKNDNEKDNASHNGDCL